MQSVSITTNLMLWFRTPFRWCVLYTTLCDQICQWLATGQWFSPGTPVSSTNKTNCHDITEILLKVALNTITLTITLKTCDRERQWFLYHQLNIIVISRSNGWNQ